MHGFSVLLYITCVIETRNYFKTTLISFWVGYYIVERQFSTEFQVLNCLSTIYYSTPKEINVVLVVSCFGNACIRTQDRKFPRKFQLFQLGRQKWIKSLKTLTLIPGAFWAFMYQVSFLSVWRKSPMLLETFCRPCTIISYWVVVVIYGCPLCGLFTLQTVWHVNLVDIYLLLDKCIKPFTKKTKFLFLIAYNLSSTKNNFVIHKSVF